MAKGFVFCPFCHAPIQRLLDPNTTPEDGLKKHIQTVHPHDEPPWGNEE